MNCPTTDHEIRDALAELIRSELDRIGPHYHGVADTVLAFLRGVTTPDGSSSETAIHIRSAHT